MDGREALANSVYGDWKEEAVRRWQIANTDRDNGHDIAEKFGDRALSEYRNIRGRLSANRALRGEERTLAERQRGNLLQFAGEERRIEGALLDAEALDALGDTELALGQARAAAAERVEDRAIALGHETGRQATSGLSVTGASALQRRDFMERRMLRSKQQEQLQIMRQVDKGLQRCLLYTSPSPRDS